MARVRQRAEADARTNGCYLNPDQDFLNDLFEGIRKNEDRYGYPNCPCRLASGNLDKDSDVICPCAYRDIDVLEYGCCYCSLYVRKDVLEGKTKTRSIPERRPMEIQNRAYGASTVEAATATTGKQSENTTQKASETASPFQQQPTIKRRIWYCRQCGYVSYRENAPYICPICKARKEMFSPLILSTEIQG